MRKAAFGILACLGMLQSGAISQPRSQCINCSNPSPMPTPPQPVDLRGTFHFTGGEISGEFMVRTADGRLLRGQEAVGVALGRGATVVTGPSGQARMVLPDGTQFTFGPNSEMVYDEFIFDPDNSISRMSARLIKGLFRWITGRIVPRTPESALRINVPVGCICIRGTDFEAEVDPAGSGHVTLHQGEISLEEYDSDRRLIIHPGQTLRWENFRITGVQ